MDHTESASHAVRHFDMSILKRGAGFAVLDGTVSDPRRCYTGFSTRTLSAEQDLLSWMELSRILDGATRDSQLEP